MMSGRPRPRRTHVSWTPPTIAERSGGLNIVFHKAIMFLQLLWALFVMQETKGVPLEKIQKAGGTAEVIAAPARSEETKTQ